jgi:hypothetical protein
MKTTFAFLFFLPANVLEATALHTFEFKAAKAVFVFSPDKNELTLQ